MNEQEKILNMVAEGKISVADGEKLLKAIGAKSNKAETPKETVTELIQVGSSKKEGLPASGKVVIDIRSSRGENIKVNVPLKLAGLASKMIPKDRLAEVEKEGFNIREILSNLTDMIEDIDEDIVNISSSNGDRIRIYVEK
jgi:SHOCT-like protein